MWLWADGSLHQALGAAGIPNQADPLLQVREEVPLWRRCGQHVTLGCPHAAVCQRPIWICTGVHGPW